MATQWQPAGSNRGPQGIQGVPGPQGATGPVGPSGVTTLRGATDYDNAVAPTDGQAILWVAAGSKFKAVTITPAAIGAAAATHQHDASDVNAGRLNANRLPFVLSPIRTGTVVTSVTSDAASGAGNLINLSVQGNISIIAPISPSDFQQLRYHMVAFGAQRTVTFGGGIVPAANLPAGLGPYTVPRGSVLTAILEYLGNRATSADVAAPVWGLLAAAVV